MEIPGRGRKQKPNREGPCAEIHPARRRMRRLGNSAVACRQHGFEPFIVANMATGIGKRIGISAIVLLCLACPPRCRRDPAGSSDAAKTWNCYGACTRLCLQTEPCTFSSGHALQAHPSGFLDLHVATCKPGSWSPAATSRSCRSCSSIRFCSTSTSTAANITWPWLKKPVPKWNPGKWKHGPNLRSPSCLILSHSHMSDTGATSSMHPECTD